MIACDGDLTGFEKFGEFQERSQMCSSKDKPADQSTTTHPLLKTLRIKGL